MSHKNWRWQHDINHFGKLKEILASAKTEWIRRRIISRLKDIQSRWPTHINTSEIPEV